jgi:Flp pilus assembly pilin Flp
MRNILVPALLGDNGATLMEYALIILFVLLLVVIPLTLLGANVLALFNNFLGAF